MEAVDRLQAVVEGLLLWLKENISSSESSNPRTISPNIELEDIFKFEDAAHWDPDPKQLNEIFEFRDPEPEQLNKMFEFEEAAQIDSDQEQMNKVFKFRDPKPKQLNEISEV